MSRVPKTAALALATALCAAITAVPAQAKTEQIKSGKTSVTLSPLVKALLAKTGISGKHGKMTGRLQITAAWAHLINKLLGVKVAHAGQNLGELTMAVKMA